MTLTLVATPDPTHSPPRVLLEVAEDDPFNSVQDVVLYRDGVKLRFDPIITSVGALAYDYDAPFDVPLAYRADADEVNTAPEWSEAWASLAAWQSSPSGGAAVGWAVAGGVASSTSPDAAIYRTTATPITQVTVTAPSNLTLELLNSLGGRAGSVKVTPDGMVTLSGSNAAKTVAGSGAFVLTVAAASLTVQGTGWSATVPFVGPATGVLLKAPGAVTYVAQYGTPGNGVGQFGFPRGIAFDSSGNFFVLDETRRKVLKFNSAGVFQSEFGTHGNSAGEFQKPRDIAIGPAGNIWVTDSQRSKVIKFNSSGVYQAEYGSAGSGNGQFNEIRGIAFDSSGNFFIADGSNNRIQKFNSSGVYQSQFGTTGTGNGQFKGPHGITIDSANNIWVTEWDNNRVQAFNSAGTYLGQFGSAGDGNGQFNHPAGIAVDSAGYVYVTDAYNHRGQKFDSSGVFVASFGVFGSGDGQLDFPIGIAVRSNGDIYVVDSYNGRVQKGTQAGGSVDDIVVLGTGLQLRVSATDTETLSPTGDDAGIWLTNANQPDLAILVEKDDCGGEPYYLDKSTRESTILRANAVQLAIEGSAEIRTVALGPRRREEWTMGVVCMTEAARDELLAVLADSAAINLRIPTALNYLGLDGGFYGVTDVSTRRTDTPAVTEECVVYLPLTPSGPPAYKPLWQWNARTLAQTGMSSRDVNNAFPSSRALLVGPVEV